MGAAQPLPTPNEYSQVEGTTGQYAGILLDHQGTPVPGSVLETLTLTLYCQDGTQTTINNRNQQNVLQQNGVTVGEDGVFLWEIAPDDNEILHDGLAYERHTALFHGTWASGAREFYHEVVLVVRNLQLVPA